MAIMTTVKRDRSFALTSECIELVPHIRVFWAPDQDDEPRDCMRGVSAGEFELGYEDRGVGPDDWGR